MAKLKKNEKSYNTTVWRITGSEDGPFKYYEYFESVTGKLRKHASYENGIILSITFTKKFLMRGVKTNRNLTWRFAIKHDDISHEEILSWSGKEIKISKKEIVVY